MVDGLQGAQSSRRLREGGRAAARSGRRPVVGKRAIGERSIAHRPTISAGSGPKDPGTNPPASDEYAPHSIDQWPNKLKSDE
jgi:hypothetical protein